MQNINSNRNGLYKYDFTGKICTISHPKSGRGVTLYQIRAIKDFGNINKGDIGGWIEKEDNLSHGGNAWVYKDASVFDDARVKENAKVHDIAQVYENAVISGNATVDSSANVYGNAHVSDNAYINDFANIHGEACICGNAEVCGSAEVCDSAQVFGEAKVSGSAVIYGDADIFGDVYINGHADIFSTDRYISFGPIGSKNKYATIFYGRQDDTECIEMNYDGSSYLFSMIDVAKLMSKISDSNDIKNNNSSYKRLIMATALFSEIEDRKSTKMTVTPIGAPVDADIEASIGANIGAAKF